MSISLKTQDSESSYSKYRSAIMQLETDDLETLLDMYAMLSSVHSEYYMEAKALEDELTFRKTLLGKELG